MTKTLWSRTWGHLTVALERKGADKWLGLYGPDHRPDGTHYWLCFPLPLVPWHVHWHPQWSNRMLTIASPERRYCDIAALDERDPIDGDERRDPLPHLGLNARVAEAKARRRRHRAIWPTASKEGYVGGRGPDHLREMAVDRPLADELDRMAALVPPPPYGFALGSGGMELTAVVAETADGRSLPLADFLADWMLDPGREDDPGAAPAVPDHRPVMEYFAAAAEVVPRLTREMRRCWTHMVQQSVELTATRNALIHAQADLNRERAIRLRGGELDWEALNFAERQRWLEKAREELIAEGRLPKKESGK